MSTNENIGPHLLGRVPSTPDNRDYKLSHFLSDDPLDAALAAVLKGHYLTAKAVKNWMKIATERIEAMSPAPTPPPPSPPIGDVIWRNSEPTLDQGNYGTCVGNGWAQWGNTLPIGDKFAEVDARQIYFEATIFDGSPDDPDAPGGGQQGSTVRSGAKAMQKRSRLNAYAFAASIDEVIAWIRDHGPIVFGTDWTNDMFEPDANGFVVPTGGVAGGHCYVGVGDIPAEKAILCQNSWGDWGIDGGFFKITYDNARKLFAAQGEACAAVELP